MCGIAGYINCDGSPASSTILKRMADALAHRGPDGEGVFIDGNIGLAHRRLAILDTSPAAAQPLASSCGDIILTYNGEIYNFHELRAILQARGHVFHSTGDAAVVAASWLEWGDHCVERFNGHFAFAVLDRREQTLHLARDRYGAKPLYWFRHDGLLAFASEQKALFAHPDISHTLDYEGLLEYFTFQNFFTDRTLSSHVRLFPAATVVRIGKNGSPAPFRKYWDYAFQEPDVQPSRQACIEELDQLLSQAVRRQLVADVEVGAYLSGGLDSGTISAISARDLPFIKSFTCGFDLSSASGMELQFDERIRAEAMSAKFRTEHYEMVLKSGDMERVMPRLAAHIEEPRVGQCYPNFYIAQLASKFVKVVLSGAGGDELFGGYPWRYYRACDCKSFYDFADRYYGFWQRLIPDVAMERVFAPVWEHMRHVDTRDIFRSVFSTTSTHIERPEDAINLSLYFEMKTFLHGLLIIDDKLSMAHSLETRVPFLDNDLVDFAMRCPVAYKLNNLADAVRLNENQMGPKGHVYFQRTRDGKQIMRDVARRYIPEDIAAAVKQGFSAPDASWFKGESMAFVRRKLLPLKAKIYGFMDYSVVSGLIEEHLSGKKNRRLLIWSLLNFEYFLDQTS